MFSAIEYKGVDGAVGYTLDIPLNSMNPVKAE
jgi:hypothetical protein